MKVEFLEAVKHGGQSYDEGDRKTFDDATGKYFCDNGWAKDLSGDYQTADRDTSRRILAPDGVKVSTKVEKING